MSVLGGKVLTARLQTFVLRLVEKVAACRKATPPWLAAFQGENKDIFDENTAFQMMLKKVDLVIGHHNTVHQVMSTLSRCSLTLEVTPKILVNEITMKSIAIGKAILAEAKVAHTVCEGVDILDAGRTEDDASAHAAAFLAKHDNSRQGIPACFWNKLEALAHHAGPVKMSLPPAKAEPSEAASSAQLAADGPDSKRDGGAVAGGTASSARPAVTGTAPAVKRMRRL